MEKVAGLNWAIAKIIKEMRESKGWTQAQLAGFAGLSDVYIAKLEQGARGDSINALVQIAAALGMPPSELMKEIEIELAGGPRKPKGTRGRPSQSAKCVVQGTQPSQ
jgi:transcriptional regulator with XRE-family HTH domain